MKNPRNYKSVINYFNECPEDIKSYFEHLPSLIEEYPWDVCISYLFSYVEYIHSLSLYCAIVKLHKVDPEMTWDAVNDEHMTRDKFRDFLRSIIKKPIPSTTIKKIKKAERVRDKVMHGKSSSDAEIRKSVINILDYASEYNEFIYQNTGFKPFGSLRGFKGRSIAQDKSTSRWILKGMGFTSIK